MAKFTREEIIERTEQLAKMIRETEEVEFYQRAEKQINQNQKVNDRIAQIKKLQKQAVNLQHYGKIAALKDTEAKLTPYKKKSMNCQLSVNLKKHKKLSTICCK